MKRIFFLAILFLAFINGNAQRVAKTTAVQKTTVEQDIAAYQFDQAISKLQSEIIQLKRRRKDFSELQSKLEQVERLSSMQDATQQITFIDSLVVPKKNFLSKICLGNESGSVTYYSRALHELDTLGCTVFQPEIGNDIYYAAPVEGHMQLFSNILIDSKWGTPTKLDIDIDAFDLGYPFMLADGATLYFSAKNSADGLGGFDLYRTRWNADDKQFVTPEHLSMPFNSPANDYFIAIDEFNQLGWFVTDRNQPADTVCIYVFIPTSVRKNWIDTPGFNEEKLSQYARLANIVQTQTDSHLTAQAKSRLESVRNTIVPEEKSDTFSFVVSSGVTYHQLSDFKKASSREIFQQWFSEQQSIIADRQVLDMLRAEYAKADNTRRTTLRSRILSLEQNLENRISANSSLAKRIRQAEN